MQLRIKDKLLIGFGTTILILLVVGSVSILRTRSMIENTVALHDNAVTPLTLISQLNLNLQKMRVLYRDILISTEQIDRDKYGRLLDASSTQVENAITQLQRLKLSAEEKSALNAFVEINNDFNRGIATFRQHIATDQKQAQAFLRSDSFIRAATGVVEKLAVLEKNINERSENLATESEEVGQRTQLVVLGLLIVGLALALIYASRIIAGIRTVIDELLHETEKLTTAAIAGDLKYRANPEETNFEFRGIVEGINKTLDGVITPLNLSAKYIERISKGDLPPKNTDKFGASGICVGFRG